MIRYHHNIHKTLEREVLRALQSRGLETRTVKRFQYNDEVVRWADIIFTTGSLTIVNPPPLISVQVEVRKDFMDQQQPNGPVSRIPLRRPRSAQVEKAKKNSSILKKYLFFTCVLYISIESTNAYYLWCYLRIPLTIFGRLESRVFCEMSARRANYIP